ncbi:MAG: Wzz/FepE/Etk N-terminal domain-containing protein [Pseudomonadales bacterium]|jgi:uncharacterized protein involved in exopolysaccharide biosynthesis|nr:Wzz/FepE/Etk N-terminal domain-containing protein [Pseudomonadales bacterium]
MAAERLQGSPELDLVEVVRALWRRRVLIFASAVLGALLGAVGAWLLPDVYRSEVILAPQRTDNGLAALGGGLGNLASLAGIGLEDGGPDPNDIALELIRSRRFFTEFVERHPVLPQIAAAQSWDPATGELRFDAAIFDAANGQWLEETGPSGSRRRTTVLDAHDLFVDEMLTVERDDITGLVTIAVEHISPVVAQQIAEWLVRDINAAMRDAAVQEARRAIEYLRGQSEATAVAELRQVIYTLIEEQMQTVMLANVREEYLWRTIDPPIVPEERSGPNRPLMVVLAVFAGFALGLLLALFLPVIPSASSGDAPAGQAQA